MRASIFGAFNRFAAMYTLPLLPLSFALALASCGAGADDRNGAGSSVAAEEAATSPSEHPQDMSNDTGEGLFADMRTSMGTIRIRLEYTKAPMTVANFVGLAEGQVTNTAKPEGQPYYDGIIFHRVIPGFMVQCGDPTGTGMGGPGYAFDDEIAPDLRHDRPGVLSMANAGPGTNGSQFFITHGPTPHLDGRHAVFGFVVEGQEVVNAIGNVPRDGRDRPVQDVRIEKLTIERVGDAAKAWDAKAVLKANASRFRAR
jgi:cyclophilin family peptidyl-prolyl cis-trans isomerase